MNNEKFIERGVEWGEAVKRMCEKQLWIDKKKGYSLGKKAKIFKCRYGTVANFTSCSWWNFLLSTVARRYNHRFLPTRDSAVSCLPPPLLVKPHCTDQLVKFLSALGNRRVALKRSALEARNLICVQIVVNNVKISFALLSWTPHIVPHTMILKEKEEREKEEEIKKISHWRLSIPFIVVGSFRSI